MGLTRFLLLGWMVACGVPPVDGVADRAEGLAVEAPAELPADCAKGCSAPTPDETHPLEEEVALQHLRAYGAQPLGAVTVDLETLLFHREVALGVMEASPGLLSADHERFLRDELGRTRVEVAFRLVDDTGELLGEAVRSSPLKEKQHVVLEGTGSLKHIEVSGKTKRVGLNHLWSRW